MAEPNPLSRPESLAAFLAAFPNDDACASHVFNVRFCQGTVCPRCGKPAQWKTARRRRMESRCCHFEMTPCAGTLLDGSHAPVTRFLHALLLTAVLDGRLSANELARHLGTTVKTAWRISDRIRAHMAMLSGPDTARYDGKVYVDEMHLRCVNDQTGVRKSVSIFGITDGINTTFYCVPDRKAVTLCGLIERIVAPGSEIVADGFASYDRLAGSGYRLSRVKHSLGMWKNDRGDTTAPIETRWREVRRRIERVHQRVYSDYLWKYLGQLSFIMHCRKLGISPFWASLARFPEFSPDTLHAAAKAIDLRSRDCSGAL